MVLTTGLLILFNYALNIFELGDFLFETTPNIVLNMDKLYIIFHDIIGILVLILSFYIGLFVVNIKIDRFYIDFKNALFECQ